MSMPGKIKVLSPRANRTDHNTDRNAHKYLDLALPCGDIACEKLSVLLSPAVVWFEFVFEKDLTLSVKAQ